MLPTRRWVHVQMQPLMQWEHRHWHLHDSISLCPSTQGEGLPLGLFLRWKLRDGRRGKRKGGRAGGRLGEIKSLILIQKIVLTDETWADSLSQLPGLFLCVIPISLLCVCRQLASQVTELHMKHPSSRAGEKKPLWILIWRAWSIGQVAEHPGWQPGVPSWESCLWNSSMGMIYHCIAFPSD